MPHLKILGEKLLVEPALFSSEILGKKLSLATLRHKYEDHLQRLIAIYELMFTKIHKQKNNELLSGLGCSC